MWAGSANQIIIGLFKVDGVKLNSENYCDFMEETFFEWYESHSCSFKVKRVFIHDNAPSHEYKFICEFFQHKRFTGEKIMK